MTQECYSNCVSVISTCELNASRARSSLTHRHAHVMEPTCWKASVAWVSVDTEAGMLSGISRKRSIRSNPYWFTEFCNSQCLSHFAAPFIVVRAETSVAESCKASGVERTTQEDTSQHKCKVQNPDSEARGDTTVRSHPIRCPRVPARGHRHKSPSPPRASPRFVHMVWLDACE